MRQGKEPTDERLAAAYDLARQIVLTRGKVDDAVITRATASGFGTAEILEIVAECTFAGLVGTVDNVAGRVELDAFWLRARGPQTCARATGCRPKWMQEREKNQSADGFPSRCFPSAPSPNCTSSV
jgi:hypothetical protein